VDEERAGAIVTASFEPWYRREHPRLVSALTVVSLDSDVAREAAAEAFTRALERWERVSRMDAPAAWVHRVAINVIRRRMRRAAFERAVLPLRRTQSVELPVLAPEVWTAVRALPVRQRTAIALRYVLDLPQHEVARLMGVAPGTVPAMLAKAKARLAVLLADQSTDQGVPHA
jgi:RNA polymerase sigma-70 factor (ECF subfamily)